VSWWYYKDELTQEEIARRLSISRASVGRMLDRARKVGLVTISLKAEALQTFELSARLCEAFGLDEALVVPDFDSHLATQRAINARLGIGGAQYMRSHLRPGVSLGVGWGDTMARFLAACDFSDALPIHLVTLTGGVEGYLQAFTYLRAENDGSQDMITASVVQSPIIASTATIAKALRSEPTIQQVLKMATTLPYAVVGIGTVATDSTLVQMGYISAVDARALANQGAVGDILGQCFDINGKVLDLPIHDRRIGIELGDLHEITTVVGIAGGPTKAEAILGALRGNYLNVLVTDELVAQRLLELAP